jgi:hypothetical protein
MVGPTCLLVQTQEVSTMNIRRFAKSIAAAILAVGVIVTGVSAPAASAAPGKNISQRDTGWG